MLPEPRVRIRVAQSAGPEGAPDAWTPFVGEVLGAPPASRVAVGQRVAGFGPRGDEIEVPPWAVASVPDDLASERALLLPLAAVAVRAARRVGARAGDACVVGTGVLAELVAQALRAAGLPRVTAAAEVAAELPGVVVDTTGDPAVIAELLERTPRRGRIALVGACGGRTVDVDFYRTVHQRGLEVIGIHAFGPLSAIASDDDRASDLAAAETLLRAARP